MNLRSDALKRDLNFINLKMCMSDTRKDEKMKIFIKLNQIGENCQRQISKNQPHTWV